MTERHKELSPLLIHSVNGFVWQGPKDLGHILLFSQYTSKELGGNEVARTFTNTLK